MNKRNHVTKAHFRGFVTVTDRGLPGQSPPRSSSSKDREAQARELSDRRLCSSTTTADTGKCTWTVGHTYECLYSPNNGKEQIKNKYQKLSSHNTPIKLKNLTIKAWKFKVALSYYLSDFQRKNLYFSSTNPKQLVAYFVKSYAVKRHAVYDKTNSNYQVILNTCIVWWNAWNQTYSIMSCIIPITFFISYYHL